GLRALCTGTALALLCLAGAALAQTPEAGAESLTTLSAPTGNSQRAAPTAVRAPGDACLTITDVFSVDTVGDADNDVILLNIGAGNEILEMGWDIGVTTIPPSALDDV